jgi:hypothetical protein
MLLVAVAALVVVLDVVMLRVLAAVVELLLVYSAD